MKELFVTCPQGLETLLLQELSQIGIPGRKGFRGVFVPQKLSYVYQINYCSRLAIRVLWPLREFACRDQEELYKEAKKIPWDAYMTLSQTFAIDANVHHPNLRNSHFAALVVKDAISDFFREKVGERPSVSIQSPDIQLNLFIYKGKATLSFDTSGAPLYKRGWRKEITPAPLQESLAAAILTLANYREEDILLDPFCGSGTFLIEAALLATKTPPGYFRKSWGFFHLPEFSLPAWEKIRQEADSHKLPLPKGKIFGIDKDHKVLQACRTHLSVAQFTDSIEVKAEALEDYTPEVVPSLVVCNPPYGKRLEAPRDLGAFLRYFLKGKCGAKTRAYILTPDLGLPQAMRMPLQERFALFHGGIDVKLFSLASCT